MPHFARTGITLMLMGMVTLLTALPLCFALVPPNCWYGVRISRAFASRENWYRINRVGGWLLVLWSLGMMAVGWWVQHDPRGAALSPDMAPLLIIGSLSVVVLAVVVYAAVATRGSESSP